MVYTSATLNMQVKPKIAVQDNGTEFVIANSLWQRATPTNWNELQFEIAGVWDTGGTLKSLY